MKTITFICLIIFFTSCKKDLQFDFGGGWGDFSSLNFPPSPPDSSIKVAADIYNSGGLIYNIPGYNAYFERHDSITPGDSSSIYFQASTGHILLGVKLINILTVGTYSFGHSADSTKAARALFTEWNPDKVDSFFNDDNVLSGSLIIDTLTAKRIAGSFNVRCWNGTQYYDVKNGIFSGNFY